ncbi:hypothetical protein FQR65_LT17735 [Abscondita terminalis]|nr:hypothetical protein FQR65_LT17735 [Abscondita terminalis]
MLEASPTFFMSAFLYLAVFGMDTFIDKQVDSGIWFLVHLKYKVRMFLQTGIYTGDHSHLLPKHDRLSIGRACTVLHSKLTTKVVKIPQNIKSYELTDNEFSRNQPTQIATGNISTGHLPENKTPEQLDFANQLPCMDDVQDPVIHGYHYPYCRIFVSDVAAFIGIAIGSILPALFRTATKEQRLVCDRLIAWFQAGGKVSINPLMAIIAILIGGDGLNLIRKNRTKDISNAIQHRNCLPSGGSTSGKTEKKKVAETPKPKDDKNTEEIYSLCCMGPEAPCI